jgi:hypothetical protein
MKVKSMGLFHMMHDALTLERTKKRKEKKRKEKKRASSFAPTVLVTISGFYLLHKGLIRVHMVAVYQSGDRISHSHSIHFPPRGVSSRTFLYIMGSLDPSRPTAT